MAFDQITKCVGLVSQFSPLQVAAGALNKANDCVLTRENVIQNRRGYANYATLSNNISKFLTYSNRIINLNGTVLSYDNGSGTYANYSGSFSAPSGVKMRFAEAFSNLYLTTSEGIKVITDIAGTAARSAGAPRSLDLDSSTTGGSGFLSNNKQVAYRVVIKRTDANSNVLFGYPSTRNVISNTSGGSRNISITLPLPSEITVNDVIQVYRTAQATVSGSSDVAGEEMALVYQINPTSAEVSALSMTFTDSIDDSLRGASLYTAPSQEGISQANDRPPVAKDIALYKSNFMFYANTKTKQRLFFNLVGVSGLTGNTITLAGITYNFGASEIVSGGGSPQVKVTSTGVAATDIDTTARSFVRVINKYASNTSVYAYYLSGPADLPGQIMIEERGVGASAFTIQSSNTTIQAMIFPYPPVSPSTNTASTSTNSTQVNALYYSKNQQPEAVPSLNYLLVGSANEAILRIFALRDSLIVIKEKSVWRITGEDPSSFVATPIDTTTFCKSANSCAILSNQVIMLSNQGVVAVSESGVQVISRDIEPSIIPLLLHTSISTLAVGIAYESDRHYLLSVPTASSDTVQNQTYVYNIFTKAWTRWTFGIEDGLVDPSTDKLFFNTPSSAIVRRERKDLTDDDYRDPDSSITITSISGDYVSFTSTTTPQSGYLISQGSTSINIKSLTLTTGVYTALMESTPPISWAAGAATLYPSVNMEVEYHAWFAGTEGVGRLKQVRQVGFFADNIQGNNSASKIFGTFRTNLDEVIEEYPITIGAGAWGSGAWGAFAWGGGGDPYGYPVYVPQNKQFNRMINIGFKHQNAGQKYVCTGIGIVFEIFGEQFNQ